MLLASLKSWILLAAALGLVLAGPVLAGVPKVVLFENFGATW
jgi:hypothetical protein